MKTKQTILQAFVAVLLLSAIARGADGDPNQSQDPNAMSGVTIALTSFDVNEARLEFQYQITNKSEKSIWICDGVGLRYLDPPVETYLTNDPNDGYTLHFRRRIYVPTINWWVAPPYVRYTRLDSNDVYLETMTLPIPIPRNELFFAEAEDMPLGEVCVSNMIVEVGYYTDLPQSPATDETRTLIATYLYGWEGWERWQDEQVLKIIVKGVQLHVGVHWLYEGG